MSHLLEAVGVVKQFGGLRAVDGVDLHVDAGEMVGLIGPNGSGKTTMFDCLSRVQPVTEGTIVFDGADVTNTPAHEVGHLGLARTFQVIRVYRELTVIENMQLSRQWGEVRWHQLLRASPPATTERADHLIDFLLLSRLRDEPAATLSGGQRRLLEIGMALMSRPKLVLLDEATSGVNPSLVEQIKERLIVLNANEGITFLLVEHDVSFVKDLCERVIVLNQGRKLAEGTPTEIMTNRDVIEAYFGDDGTDPGCAPIAVPESESAGTR